MIGFITNSGWIDKDVCSGMRKIFAEEFSEIYILNLKGDILGKNGDIAKRAGENVFDIKTGVAITILVKNPESTGAAKIFYYEVDNYLKREEKFAALKNLKTVLNDDFKIIVPNEKFDWINQRGNEFEKFIALAPEKKFDAKSKTFFIVNSRGMETARDAFLYNFSKKVLQENISTLTDFDEKFFQTAIYRPFNKENIYADKNLIHRFGQFDKFFPTKKEKNFLICVSGVGSRKNFSVFITKKICDLHFNEYGQCFPLYWYEEKNSPQTELKFDGIEKNFVRRDGVSDFILSRAKNLYRDVTKEEIFYYVYGFLHLPSYREKFSAELKKSLPRIFLVESYEDFKKISSAGRSLAEIHLNYENFSAPEGVEVEISAENYFVRKMKLLKKEKILIYNEFITIKNIPEKIFEYVVNGRSPIEWIIERYQIKIDKASGIENNPNDYCEEHGDEKYILKLLLSSMTVSLKTLEIVENLPDVDFEGGFEYDQ